MLNDFRLDGLFEIFIYCNPDGVKADRETLMFANCYMNRHIRIGAYASPAFC